MNSRILLIIPAYNEAESIPKVLAEVPWGLLQEVVVVSNGSTDATEANARAGGATVLQEPKRGYGSACLKGIAYAAAKPAAERPDIIVFIDGDYSDYPAQMPEVLAPILNDGHDMVIGSRALGNKEKGSVTPQQVFGNWLATRLLRLLYRVRYTDLGPFRAIRFDKLMALGMKDPTYGWTIEMQLKAAKKRYKVTEVPVHYRKRIGQSKVSGTLRGSIGAGYKILLTIFRYL